MTRTWTNQTNRADIFTTKIVINFCKLKLESSFLKDLWVLNARVFIAVLKNPFCMIEFDIQTNFMINIITVLT